MALKIFQANSLPEVIVARPFNILGPGMSEKLFLGSFASQIAKIEKGLLPPVLKVGNLKSIRDFLSVEHVASSLLVLADKGLSGQVYNICSGYPMKIKDILDILIKYSKVKIEVMVDKSRTKNKDVSWNVGDNTKISGLEKICFSKEGIMKTVESTLNWYRGKVNNEN